jgi:hypothetical protein
LHAPVHTDALRARTTGEEGYEQEKAAQMIKEEHERMRALWRRHGLSDELYRRFMMYLLNQRSQGMDSTATAYLSRVCPQGARE